MGLAIFVPAAKCFFIQSAMTRNGCKQTIKLIE